MIKYFPICAILVSFLLVRTAAYAETTVAPCGSFQKMPDGKWNAVKPVKILHGTASAMINPGTIVGPGTLVAGADVYAALQKSCH
jgi:hypothetical protein